MLLRIPAPAALERKVHPTKIPPEFAYVAQHLELGELGRVKRGKGLARAEVPGYSSTYQDAAVLVQQSCRRVLITSTADGYLKAVVTNAAGAGGDSCVGPLPLWNEGTDDNTVYVPATAEGTTVILANAVAGRSYEIKARGRWSQDSTLTALYCGPTGTLLFANVGGGGVFDGFRHGEFVIKLPGGSWQSAGASVIVTPSQAGDILGSFADEDGLFGDNDGFMAVTVTEVQA